MEMDTGVDHYHVLGLPSGEEGAKLTEKEITHAYRSKALKLHPDKKHDDPNATSIFQQLRTSYDILIDDKARNLFDDLCRVKEERERSQFQRVGKRRKMVSDLERREREASAADRAAKVRKEEEDRIHRKLKEEISQIRANYAAKVRKEEEDRIGRKLKEEISRFRAMFAKKGVPDFDIKKMSASSHGGGGVEVDGEKVLKVSWKKVGEEYSSDSLKGFFSEFGEVEDVVISNKKKRGSALIAMATKEQVVAALGATRIGRLDNPFSVSPLEPATGADPLTASKSVEPEKMSDQELASSQAFENSVLEKLRKAAAKQRCS